MRTFTKLAVVVAAGTAVAAVVRRYDLLNRGTVLAEQGIAAATELANDLLSKYDDYTSDQTGDDTTREPEAAHTRGPVDSPSSASVGYGDVR